MNKFFNYINQLHNSKTLTTIRDRLKSHTVWMGIISQICIILALCLPDSVDEVKIITTAILEIATFIGFINNPGDRGEL